MYLRDCWYAAAWPDEVTSTPIRRTILGEPIVFYRVEDGDPVALIDRCPHRLVPLSLGALVGGNELQCAYHGLRFDHNGQCTANPDGKGTIPHSAHVRAFPLRLHCGILWVWMGDPAHSSQVDIPAFETFDDGSQYRFANGYMHVAANYQLITDNLLDLSHVEFLHPQLKPRGDFESHREVRQDGDTLWSMFWRYACLPNVFWKRFWPSDTPGDLHTHMRWDPPALMLLDSGMGACGEPDSEAIGRPSLHLLTPETMTSTHYFWTFRCSAGTDNEVEQTRALGVQAFANEDKPIIEAQQRNVVDADTTALSRGMLTADSAAIRARKILQQRITRQIAPTAY